MSTGMSKYLLLREAIAFFIFFILIVHIINVTALK